MRWPGEPSLYLLFYPNISGGLGSFFMTRQNERETPAAELDQIGAHSAPDRVAALPVFALGGSDLEAHLLANGARQETANRMRLPVGSFHELLQRGSVRPTEQPQDLSSFAPSRAPAGFARLVTIGALARFLVGVAFLPDPGLDGATRGFRGATLAFVCTSGAAFGTGHSKLTFVVESVGRSGLSGRRSSTNRC